MPAPGPGPTDVLFNWSGGKDSAMALARMLADEGYRVVELLTTVTEAYDRVSMHGVRRELLRTQAVSIGLPLRELVIPSPCSNEQYEALMRELLTGYIGRGITTMAFGDLYLEGIREYRESKLSPLGVTALFPLWGEDTIELARRFVGDGFRAVVTCVDTQQLGASFTGRELDEAFFADLPAGVDPCGENGEFHSFVYDGPIFTGPVGFTRGEVVLRDERFSFIDLLPAG